MTSAPAQQVPTHGRHSAPEAVEWPASDTDLGRRGRHAEPEWSREWFDAVRDEDPLDWLGFAAVD